MNSDYIKLKSELSSLGYTNFLPFDAVPLVQCLVADLLQTTQSLQHYVDLAKKAIQQRDNLMLEAEPYKCENGKLIKDNNDIRKENIILQEELQKLDKELKRNNDFHTREIQKLEMQLKKFQLRCKQLDLKGVCADTYSFRCKSKTFTGLSKKKDENNSKVNEYEEKIENLNSHIDELQQSNLKLKDEIDSLLNQLENRESELLRMERLLEGGRPYELVKNECCSKDVDKKIINMAEEINKLIEENKKLETKLSIGLVKQHEAMAKAVELVDQNTQLKEEITKVDSLAIKVEEECNNRIDLKEKELRELRDEVNKLKIEKNHLEMKYRDKIQAEHNNSFQEYLQENDLLRNEIKSLKNLNKNLEDKILKLLENLECFKDKQNKGDLLATKQDLQYLFDKERKQYENYIENMQQKIHCTVENLNKSLNHRKENILKTCENEFIKNLHRKINSCEQQIIELKNENSSLKNAFKSDRVDTGLINELQTKIQQLNLENSELLRENLQLSEWLSTHKEQNDNSHKNMIDNLKMKHQIISEENNELAKKISDLIEEKNELNYKNSKLMTENESLVIELNNKHKQYEQVYEENCSYRMSSRSGKATLDYLKEECRILKEKNKILKEELAKEKAVSSHTKNLTVESERTSNELHKEVLDLQKQLTIKTSRFSEVEKRFKEAQIENSTLKSENAKLIENIKSIDTERDRLIIEIDNKTEQIVVLEDKLRGKDIELEKLEAGVYDLKSKLTKNHLLEHKNREHESIIKMLENDIKMLKKDNENALMENTRLLNEIADSKAKQTKVESHLHESQKEVESLKSQLQHYVAEVKHIEDLLSQKEKQREAMLEHFANLSVEANLLESNNHSLENEATAKYMQIKTYMEKIKELEKKLEDKNLMINKQSDTISDMSCKISKLNDEINLLKDERIALEGNVFNLKELIHSYENRNKSLSSNIERTDSELQTWEEKFLKIQQIKEKLENDNELLRSMNNRIEQLLKNAQKEVIELKLALQDATTETKMLKEQVHAIDTSDRTKKLEPLREYSMSEQTSESQMHDEFEKLVLSKRTKKKLSAFTADSL